MGGGTKFNISGDCSVEEEDRGGWQSLSFSLISLPSRSRIIARLAADVQISLPFSPIGVLHHKHRPLIHQYSKRWRHSSCVLTVLWSAPYPNSLALALGSLVVSTVAISQVLVQNNLDRGRPLSLLTCTLYKPDSPVCL